MNDMGKLRCGVLPVIHFNTDVNFEKQTDTVNQRLTSTLLKRGSKNDSILTDKQKRHL